MPSFRSPASFSPLPLFRSARYDGCLRGGIRRRRLRQTPCESDEALKDTMAKKASKNKRKRAGSSPAVRDEGGVKQTAPAPPRTPVPAHNAAATAAPLGPSPALYAAGIAFLAVGAASSLMLSLDHLGGLSLPGCGEGSACAEAANSIWGKVPITGDFAWPVSFLGFAYFLGALVAWIASARGVTPLFRNVARLGALISLGFVIVIVVGGYHCSYCLAGHAGNFAFWVVMELSRRSRGTSLRPLGALVLVFIVSSAALGAAKVRTQQRVEADQERQREESTAEIIAATERMAAAAQERKDNAPSTRDDSAPSKPAPPSTQAAAATDPTEPAQPPTVTATAPADEQETPERPWTGGFRGRYVYGAEEAPVRLVMITDYQCTDCNRIEVEVREMLNQRDDVSLSIKHFPMCSDCNPRFEGKRNMHRNACWAARAAEAAGILGGNDAFWDMHFWLFDHHGNFTREDLDEGLLELGYDPAEFKRVMIGDESLELVQSDIQEAIWLGLHYTPMVFINGVELKGVFARNAVPRTVAAVGAENPPPMNHDYDQPPPAADKYVGDWSVATNRPRRLPADTHPWATGASGDVKVDIVMWSDYQEPHTATADGIIRQWMADHPDSRYSFRHFPFNPNCNPVLSESASAKHPMACRASQAAEAAGRLGGLDGYWKMHAWLMEHQSEVGDETLRQAAVDFGFDADAFVAAMDDPASTDAITEDVNAAKPNPKSKSSLLYRGGIPTIYVNGKVIPRWRLEGENILERIFDKAYEDAN